MSIDGIQEDEAIEIHDSAEQALAAREDEAGEPSGDDTAAADQPADAVAPSPDGTEAR